MGAPRGAMATLLRQLSRYGLVGLVNMGVGFSVIAALTYLGTNPLAANVGGYAAGLSTSYVLNRSFTFLARDKRGTGAPFVVSFAIAYALNLVALYAAMPLAEHHELLPQIVAMAAYNVSFFVLLKLWVFAPPTEAR